MENDVIANDFIEKFMTWMHSREHGGGCVRLHERNLLIWAEREYAGTVYYNINRDVSASRCWQIYHSYSKFIAQFKKDIGEV